MDKKERFLSDTGDLIKSVLNDVAYQTKQNNEEYHIKFTLPGGMEFTKAIPEREYIKLVTDNLIIQIKSYMERLEI